MLSVRPCHEGDDLAELTALLHRAYAPLGAMGLNYTAVDQTEAVTRARLRGAHGLLAQWTDPDRGGSPQLVGTVLVKGPDPGSPCACYRRPGVASVSQFGVDPLWQGRGVGQALLAAAAGWALAQGLQALALDTAEPAAHLRQRYARWGFSEAGFTQWEGKVYRSVVMVRALAAPGPARAQSR